VGFEVLSESGEKPFGPEGKDRNSCGAWGPEQDDFRAVEVNHGVQRRENQTTLGVKGKQVRAIVRHCYQ
jgi:hypothetical protein